MKYNFIYIFVFFIILLTLFCNKKKQKINKENYKVEQSIQNKGQIKNDGPWGSIGTDRPWYDYPYVLNNIEY
jgi:hypothetical protein